MDFLNDYLPPGFTLVKTVVFGITLCVGLKIGDWLTDVVAAAIPKGVGQRRR